MAKLTEARKRANAKYNAKAYETITFRVTKGDKEKINAFATENGESINGFINRAIKQAMENSES